MSHLKIAVVGGVNLDILGISTDAFRLRDSNPGNVRFSCGGVGHNIASQAVRTGADVSLYTVFGNDRNAEWLKQNCFEEGIRIDHAMTVEGKSPVYMAIHGSDGDMLSAVNDMCLLESFTPQLLDEMLPDIDHADVCVLDTNLPEKTIIHLSEESVVPLVCDPVSTIKSCRIKSVLSRLTALKPNLLEAREMTGLFSPEDCASKLIDSGVKNVFISLGKHGLYFAGEDDRGYLSPVSLTENLQTGAGDALTAGIAIGIGMNESVRDCAIRGLNTVGKYLRL